MRSDLCLCTYTFDKIRHLLGAPQINFRLFIFWDTPARHPQIMNFARKALKRFTAKTRPSPSDKIRHRFQLRGFHLFSNAKSAFWRPFSTRRSHFLDRIGFHLLLSSWIVPVYTVYSTSFDTIRRFEQGFISSSPLYFAKISAWQTSFLKKLRLILNFPFNQRRQHFQIRISLNSYPDKHFV